MPQRQPNNARAVVAAQPQQQQPAGPPNRVVIAEKLQERLSVMDAAALAGLSPTRLFDVAMATYNRTPGLWTCDPMSIVRAIAEAGQLGLEPTGIMGGAYLVPRGGQATLLVGYRGLVILAMRSGLVQRVEARVVREKDEFDYAYGMDPYLHHKPSRDADPGPYTHAYAVIFYRDGSRQFDVMTVAEIEATRKRSSATSSGPWVTDWPEMAKKTPLRRLMKLAPLTVEALARLDEVDPEEPAPAPAPRQPGATRQAALRQQLQRQLEEPAEEGQTREVPTTDGAGGGTQGQPDAEGAVEERAPSAPAEPAQAEPAPSEAAPAPACGAVSRKLGAGPCVKPAGHREAEHEEAGGTRFTTGRDEG